MFFLLFVDFILSVLAWFYLRFAKYRGVEISFLGIWSSALSVSYGIYMLLVGIETGE